MTRSINPAYVLGPLEVVLASSHRNVLLGLRIVEQANAFPPPTIEEVQFMQLSFGSIPSDFDLTRTQFRRWLLLNGFRDVHKALRLGLSGIPCVKRLPS